MNVCCRVFLWFYDLIIYCTTKEEQNRYELVVVVDWLGKQKKKTIINKINLAEQDKPGLG